MEVFQGRFYAAKSLVRPMGMTIRYTGGAPWTVVANQPMGDEPSIRLLLRSCAN